MFAVFGTKNLRLFRLWTIFVFLEPQHRTAPHSISSLPSCVMSDDEEITCLKMIERLKKDHMQELEEQEDLFKEARQEASEFKLFADTIEFLLGHFKELCVPMLEATMSFCADYPELTSLYQTSTDTTVWCRDGVNMTEEQTKDMENRRAACYAAWDGASARELHSAMKSTLNKASKGNEVPSRVVNHLKLILVHDMEPFGFGFYTAAQQLRAIKLFERTIAACDTLRDTLWDQDLTLPIVHPSKRRRRR